MTALTPEQLKGGIKSISISEGADAREEVNCICNFDKASNLMFENSNFIFNALNTRYNI